METCPWNLRVKGKDRGSKPDMKRWELMDPVHSHRSQARKERQVDKIDRKKKVKLSGRGWGTEMLYLVISKVPTLTLKEIGFKFLVLMLRISQVKILRYL